MEGVLLHIGFFFHCYLDTIRYCCEQVASIMEWIPELLQSLADKLSLSAAPGRPIDVRVVSVKGSSCILKWAMEDDSDFPVEKYEIQMRRGWRISWEIIRTVSGAETSTQIVELKYGEKYTFRVIPINSSESGPASQRTTEIIPADLGPPNVKYNNSGKTMTLTWNRKEGYYGKQIQGYHVEQNRIDSTFGWIRVTHDLVQQEHYTALGCKTGESYKYRIITVRKDTEYISKESIEIDAIEFPGKPDQLKVFDITCRSCRLQWSAPEFDGGSEIERYIIDVTSNDLTSRKYTVSGDKRTLTIDHLIQGQIYAFSICAKNKIGNGAVTQTHQIEATGIDLSDGKSLEVMELNKLERDGIVSIKESFRLGITTIAELLDSLQPLLASVSHSEVQIVANNLTLMTDRLCYHMQITKEKINAMNIAINARMEAVVNELGQTEHLQRKKERESKDILGHLKFLKNELKNLSKEYSESEEKFERAKQKLREAELDLESRKATMETVKTIGLIGVIIPIAGWAVSAVTLPLAYTALKEGVQLAEKLVDANTEEQNDQRTRVESKRGRMKEYEDEHTALQKQITNLNENIRDLKQTRDSLQTALNQQTDCSVKIKRCTTAIEGAADRADVLQVQVKFLYDLTDVIDPLLELTRYFSLSGEETLGLLSHRPYMLTAASKLETLALSMDHLEASSMPDYKKDLRLIPESKYGQNGLEAMIQVESIKRSVSSNAVEDQQLILSQYSDCSEFLGTAPMTITLLGQLIIFSLKQDFSLNEKPPRNGFRYIKWPESFRATALQLLNAALNAFKTAQRNMDKIRILSSNLPTHLRKALQILESGKNEEIRRFLDLPLKKILISSDDCIKLSKGVESAFVVTVHLVEELQEVCVAVRSQNEKKLSAYEAELEEASNERKRLEEEEKRFEEEKMRKYESIRKAEKKIEEIVSSIPTKGKLMAMAHFDGLISAVLTDLDYISRPVQSNSEKCSSVPESAAENISNERPAHIDTTSSSIKNLEKLEYLIPNLRNVDEQFQKYINYKTENPTLDHNVDAKQANKITAKLNFILKKLSKLDNSDSMVQQVKEICEKGLKICKRLETAFGDICKIQNESELVAKIEKRSRSIKDCLCNIAQTIKDLKTTPVSKNVAPNFATNSSSVISHDLEVVKFKLLSAYKNLKRATEEYDSLAEKARLDREELSELLRENTATDMEKVDLETVGQLLCKCLKHLGSLKKQWGRLTTFFQSISNIIEISLNGNLKNFSDFAHTASPKDNQHRQLSAMKRELLYQQVFKAVEIANFVQHIANSYTDISRTHFLPVLETLPKYIQLSSNRDDSCMNKMLQQLKEKCEASQEGINEYLERKQHEYSVALRNRLFSLDSVVHNDIPRIQQTVKQLNVEDYL